MRASLLLVALLLLAGCASHTATTTSTTSPPAPAHAPALRYENLTVSAAYTIHQEECGPVTGGGGSQEPTPATAQSQRGDRTLRATYTWTPVNPTAAHMRVAILGPDGELAATAGTSPLTITLSPNELADAAGSELGFEAHPGDCNGSVGASSSQSQSVGVALAWNLPP